MKKLLLILLLLPHCAFASDYHWKVKRVVDGDTLEVEAPFLPEELQLFVRVYGLDTPEKGSRAKCDYEKQLGQEATNFTTNLVKKAKKITFKDISWDKYGGRVLASVIIDNKDLALELIHNDLGREYHGERKASWCD